MSPKGYHSKSTFAADSEWVRKMSDIRDACRNLVKYCAEHKYDNEHLSALRDALRKAESRYVVRGQAPSKWWVAHAELVHAARNVMVSFERSISRPPALDILKIKLAQLGTSDIADSARDNGAYRQGRR